MEKDTLYFIGIALLLVGYMLWYAHQVTPQYSDTGVPYRNDLQRLDAYPRLPDADVIANESLGELYFWDYTNTRRNKQYCGDVGTAAFRESDKTFDHCFY